MTGLPDEIVRRLERDGYLTAFTDWTPNAHEIAYDLEGFDLEQECEEWLRAERARRRRSA